MKYGEAKDHVRDHIGDKDIPTYQLDYFMAQGRRELETRGNFYWMVGIKDWSTIVGQQDYSITGTSTGQLGLTNFKEMRFLVARTTGTTRWTPVRQKTFGESLTFYETSKQGIPERVVIENETLYLFPPLPDKTYDMKLFYFQWTSFPTTANLGTDELLTRWPQAVIWGATLHGTLVRTKNLDLAKPYQDLLQMEIDKIQPYSDQRLNLPDIMRQTKGRAA